MDSLQSYKRKSWQWRAIVWMSLFLIFGKTLGSWTYHILGIDQVYSATTAVVNKIGLTDALNTPAPIGPQLIINVKNDTPNDYTIETKISAGQVDFSGKTFAPGEVKRFIVKPAANDERGNGLGEILFQSAPITGANNTTCQELHTLSYNLDYAQRIKQPLAVNLSAINSHMDCQNNADTPP